jgi:hypothetical protein
MLAQTFKIALEGVGDFTFRDKTFRDQLRIESMTSEILGRIPSKLRPDETGIGAVAMGFAHISVLLTEAPLEWSVETLDPLSDADADLLMTLYRRLVDQLARFRGERKRPGPTLGAGAVGVDRVPVETQVQPRAD